MSMPAKKRSGNPKARASSGRVTPKGTPPKPQPGSAKRDDAQHRARVTGRRSPMTVRPQEWRSPAQRAQVLRGVLAELERRVVMGK